MSDRTFVSWLYTVARSTYMYIYMNYQIYCGIQTMDVLIAINIYIVEICIYIYIDSYGPLTRQNKPVVIDMFTQSGDKLMIVVLFSGYL